MRVTSLIQTASNMHVLRLLCYSSVPMPFRCIYAFIVASSCNLHCQSSLAGLGCQRRGHRLGAHAIEPRHKSRFYSTMLPHSLTFKRAFTDRNPARSTRANMPNARIVMAAVSSGRFCHGNLICRILCRHIYGAASHACLNMWSCVVSH
jgi:hypothetical protein